MSTPPLIISRGRWGARRSRGFGPAYTPALEVWLHHSVTLAPNLAYLDADRDGVDDDEERAMRTLEDIGQDRFSGGISYTFAVMPSGRIYEGHGADREGAHTAGRNGIARSIVLVGDYSTHQVTDAQMRAVAHLLQHGKAAGWWRHARLDGGHQQAPGAKTACPGRHAMAAIPRINQLAAGPPITTVEDDMPTPRDLFRHRIPRQGSRLGGETTLGAVIANIDRAWEMQAARDTAILAAVTALSQNPDITAAQLELAVDAAVERHTPTAEENAAAQREFLEDIVREVVPDEQAEQIIQRIGEKLANANTERDMT